MHVFIKYKFLKIKTVYNRNILINIHLKHSYKYFFLISEIILILLFLKKYIVGLQMDFTHVINGLQHIYDLKETHTNKRNLIQSILYSFSRQCDKMKKSKNIDNRSEYYNAPPGC